MKHSKFINFKAISEELTGQPQKIRQTDTAQKYVDILDNLDDFSTPFDALPSKMNLDDNNPFITPNLPTPNEAFGSTMNTYDDDSDVPF